MYGDNPEPETVQQSDCETEIIRPASKLNTPARYDSSSEDGAVNEKIRNRRIELGVFESSKSARKCFISSESDSSVPSRPKKQSKQSAAQKPSSAPRAKRGTHSNPLPRDPSANRSSDTVQQNKKTSKITQLQRLANPKTKSNIPTSSPFTQFPTPIKGGAKQKKKNRRALRLPEGVDNVSVLHQNKRKPGRPRKGRKGAKGVKVVRLKNNAAFEEKYNDPPLHLREAIPDTHAGELSDEEDPLTTNLHSLDIEIENGLEIEFMVIAIVPRSQFLIELLSTLPIHPVL